MSAQINSNKQNNHINNDMIRNAFKEMCKLKMMIRMHFPPDLKIGNDIFILANEVMKNINNKDLFNYIYEMVGLVQKYIHD